MSSPEPLCGALAGFTLVRFLVFYILVNWFPNHQTARTSKPEYSAHSSQQKIPFSEQSHDLAKRYLFLTPYSFFQFHAHNFQPYFINMFPLKLPSNPHKIAISLRVNKPSQLYYHFPTKSNLDDTIHKYHLANMHLLLYLFQMNNNLHPLMNPKLIQNNSRLLII